ncbi:MAG: type II toxin-antitoxin system HigB family toxin [Cyanosarcina radialis HA8281-LM2]|nr:type II toxin-antitoxin system HigB family toxin [Cyanosarcina radialis HA8281-LM2]
MTTDIRKVAILFSINWQNLEEVKQSFSSAEAVGNFTVFNIKGNRYRLILFINYQKQIAFFKNFLTSEVGRFFLSQSSYFLTVVDPNLNRSTARKAIANLDRHGNRC